MGNFDFEAGRRHLAEGDVVEAIRCLLASLDVDPAHTETYVELFKAYDAAWQESGDPDVLDQMRKVAVAGLKRRATPEQKAFLVGALDRADEGILEVRRADRQAEQEARRASRRLPMFDDTLPPPRPGPAGRNEP